MEKVRVWIDGEGEGVEKRGCVKLRVRKASTLYTDVNFAPLVYHGT